MKKVFKMEVTFDTWLEGKVDFKMWMMGQNFYLLQGEKQEQNEQAVSTTNCLSLPWLAQAVHTIKLDLCNKALVGLEADSG